MRWNEPVNGIAEIADMPETVLAAFSARTGGVERRLEAKLERFIDTFDRDPTPRERWKLEREAVLDSRPRKPTAVGWRAVGYDGEDIRTLGRVRAPHPPLIFEHRIGATEPLLWIADGITWAVGAGGTWRSFVMPIVEEIVQLRP